MKLLVTGGAGFIGSAVVRHLLTATEAVVVNLDALTYAGNLQSVAPVSHSERYIFEHADICDATALARIFSEHQPDAVIHLAAESHVDRSIDGPNAFVRTNVLGTSQLLQASTAWFRALPPERQAAFRFLHVSTDEVFGDLGSSAGYFTETTPYAPSSPYAATKASSDHLVRAWQRTYGLPTLITNCSNNYGPYQFPEKLIPHMILNALSGKPLPVYGDGQQIRDWLYVDDHARALWTVLRNGEPGETYNIGGHNEQKNLNVIETICALLEELAPRQSSSAPYRSLISYVADRPGHDTRYAIDASRIHSDLGWTPAETFSSGIRKTVQWYLDNGTWWQGVLDGSYRLERIGKAGTE